MAGERAADHEAAHFGLIDNGRHLAHTSACMENPSTQEATMASGIGKSQADVLRHVVSSRPKVGQALPNGATVLKSGYARTLYSSAVTSDLGREAWAEEHVVLALNSGHFQPFVVWSWTLGTEQRADGTYGPLSFTYQGSYHRDLQDALEAYEARLEERAEAGDEVTL